MRGRTSIADARTDRPDEARLERWRSGAVAVDGRHESTPGGAAVADPDTADANTSDDRPWVTIVWDDPVNLMSYVTHVFTSYFGYAEAKATELMLQVHNNGKAVVSGGSREQMETDVDAMHGYGLWATLEQG